MRLTIEIEGERPEKKNLASQNSRLSFPFSLLSSSPLSLRYEPLVRRSSLSSLATVYALDMPGQGASPRPRRRGTGSPGALESYGSLALAAVDWLRENGMLSSPLCAFGHSGGGLAALSAEQERPGTFRVVRRTSFFFRLQLPTAPSFFFSHALILIPLSLSSSAFSPLLQTALPLRARGPDRSESSSEESGRRGLDFITFVSFVSFLSSVSALRALFDAVARGRGPEAPQDLWLQGSGPALPAEENSFLAV